MTPHAGFPHSDICGSNGYLHLTAAYRSLSRPSSADIAKASAVRPYLLDLLFFLRFVKSLFHSKKRYFFVFYTVVKVRHKRKSGGDEENRTPDPLLARQVLSQLSYTPIWSASFRMAVLL